MISGANCVRDRQQKNIEMDEAIQRIPELVGKLDRLLSRISGQLCDEAKSACVPGPPRTIPSLRGMLDEGPDYIREQIGKAMAITDEIECALF